MNRIRRNLSYANVTATLALVFAMSGGALAAKHYLLSSTKQISPKVLNSLATSNKAQFNKLIKTATAGSALTAGHATSADSATKATSAGSATSATHAISADAATSATEASRLGGQPASAYARAAPLGPLSAGLENGWGNAGSGFGPATYQVDSFGVVHLFGSVKIGVGSTSSFTTLPEGLRPGFDIEEPVAVAGPSVGEVEIETDGKVKPLVSTTFVDLDGVTFLAAP
jgi:hypothetical protein